MLNKQALNINFSLGLDTKNDPWSLQPGKFLALENTVFTKGGRLQKRNGYGALTALPDDSSTLLTTFSGNLTAVGSSITAYASGSKQWVEKGSIDPVAISTLPLIRNNLNQSYCDAAVAPNGYVCTVYTENNGGSLSYKYVVADSTTGQNIAAPSLIPSTGTATYAPKVFLLGNYFLIVFDDLVSATHHLKYLAVAVNNPTAAVTPVDVSTSYSPASTGTFDGAVYNGSLYLAWNGTGTTIKATYLTQHLSLASAVSYAANSATRISVTADQGGGVIYVSWIDGSGNVKALGFSPILAPVLSVHTLAATASAVNVTACATGNILTVYYEVTNAYSYDSGIASNFIKKNTVTMGGSVGTAAVVARSVGLASKAFIYGSTQYFLALYSSPYQPTYFLLSESGRVIAKIAYQNGPGAYAVTGLPGVSLSGDTVQFPYLFKDLIQAVNKDTNVVSGTQTSGIYSQTGINLASVTFGTSMVEAAEIGGNLNLSGGYLCAYDGYLPVENGFFLWPDSIEVTTATGSGALTAQQYYYQVTYEWTDNQGNAFRSAPSIPVTITTTTGSSTNTINVPMLRLTYKTANPVKIVVYRWSTAQQIYYQVTSITSPSLNDPTTDSIAITDALADSAILGNNILYTTGGVVENIGAPAFDSVFTFDNRLWGIDSEDKNLLWFSKQVIEATPVEMSDLFTMFVAPGIGAQGSTGPLRCGAPMDEKAALFKDSAIYYVNGAGPDNTGANNQYSQPIFVTSTVGCSNQKSIVFQPNGLMFEFQSESGNQIWLLGRDLSTQYIGAPVEEFTKNATVQSAVNVAGTNQVRFTLSSGITLMYDYYYGQWGSFSGVPAVSSAIFGGLHTFVNASGQVYQETPGAYLDGSSPVLMKFTTSWLNLAGIQGYQRAYSFYLLGNYLSPHKLQVQVAYDYNPAGTQQTLVAPSNYSAAWGVGASWGSESSWGGEGTLEQWQIYLQRQLCQSFQITVSEVFDASFGTVSGPGLTLSGITCVMGIKKGFRPLGVKNSAG